MLTISNWDLYFHKICEAVASKSPCLSRNIGAILVRDKSVISTGFNGPARGFPHCRVSCIRKTKGFKSGEGLHLCPAGHAEVNCISNAARNGVIVKGSILYMNCIAPCKDCMIHIVNSGIEGIVIDKLEWYHELSELIAIKGNIFVREFRI